MSIIEKNIPNDKRRCEWANGSLEYKEYHDNEWGVPCHDDKKLFELLILEGFQAGLSWITILKKRENFRRAFSNWDWHKISSYDDDDINRLMNDSSIVRNRRKIKAAITNSHQFIKIINEFGSFDKYIWSFTSNKIIKAKKRSNFFKELPTYSNESKIISRSLKKRGFSFVGPTIIYSYMQAIGMIDDHLRYCWKSILNDRT